MHMTVSGQDRLIIKHMGFMAARGRVIVMPELLLLRSGKELLAVQITDWGVDTIIGITLRKVPWIMQPFSIIMLPNKYLLEKSWIPLPVLIQAPLVLLK